MKKILICILSYNASAHIKEVLERIPQDFLYSSMHETHVLLLDDASKDDTYAIAMEYAKHDPQKYTVIKNPVNLRYGGNQKRGYRYAIDNKYDTVILLHGDAQYAPELLPQMAEPILSNNADVVLGSRMINKADALKGGMPYYKFFGNIALTAIQNILLGSRLAEFHTGYRAYYCHALKQIPFEENSDYFEFDTDIIIQMLRAKARVQEIPIPTFYGNEVCHVNAVKYGLLVLRSTIFAPFMRRFRVQSLMRD